MHSLTHSLAVLMGDKQVRLHDLVAPLVIKEAASSFTPKMSCKYPINSFPASGSSVTNQKLINVAI